MSTPALLDTDVESDLRRTVRRLLADQCGPHVVTALYDGDRSVVAPLWKAVAVDLGLAGLLVPQEDGGAGASLREAAVVLEEMGRFAAPAPYLTSAVMATTALLGSGSPLLADLASGDRTATLVVPFSTLPDGPVPSLVADEQGRVTGRVRSVAGAMETDTFLVPVRSDGGTAVVQMPARDVTVAPVPSLDMTRQLADLELTGVASVPLVGAPNGETAVRTALLAGAAGLTAEQVGIARYSMESTVAYLKERRQFGRVVGGFQALKHRLADLYVAVESATAASRYAVAQVAACAPDAVIAVAVAQSYCSDAALRCAEEAVQLHGGIGMTWEHPAHLYLKRAKADQIALGTPGRWRQVLAGLVDLPGPEG